MKYTAEIKVCGDIDKIIKCFEPEIKKGDRANFTTKKEKDGVLFEIEAKDPVALRATLNSITKLLSVYENMEKI